MNDLSILTLIQLNQKFYLDNASAFLKTRVNPWTGWDLVANHIPQNLDLVVDIGCGNGRWFDYLFKIRTPKVCLGLDVDSFMLEQCRDKFFSHQHCRFFQVDCVQNLDQAMRMVVKEKADLITSFGLWHHIPSYKLRLYNLHQLLSNLSPNGVLCVSLWQFASDPRYATKLRHPADVAGLVGVERNQFEEGDYFLGWQQTDGALRYCHSFADDEINRLTKDLNVPHRLIRGEGNDVTNVYLMLGVGLKKF